MRKFILSVTFLLVGLFAYSQATATLTLQGVVPRLISVAVTPQPLASSLDLAINASNILVASVNERSNSFSGYIITLESANATGSQAFFEGQNATIPDTLNYSILYDGVAVNFVSGSATITDTTGRTTGAGIDKDLEISYDGSTQLLLEDTYSDTLTFVIAAK